MTTVTVIIIFLLTQIPPYKIINKCNFLFLNRHDILSLGPIVLRLTNAKWVKRMKGKTYSHENNNYNQSNLYRFSHIHTSLLRY